MRQSQIKRAVGVMLIFAISHAFIIPSSALAKSDGGKVQVAYVGVQINGVPKDSAKRLQKRVLNLVTKESQLQLIEPEEAAKQAGNDLINSVFETPVPEAFKLIADQLHVNHVYAGKIANRNDEDERILLVGNLYRYDRETNLVHRFEVLKYADLMGVEFVRFDQEYVQTILPTQVKKNSTLPWIVLGAVTVAGLLAMTFVGSDFNNDNAANPDNPVDDSGERTK